ncbi:transposase [[Clostridium] aminophilum]|uniref:IS66 family transposase n=1 Tax=[Clostridium] aminophilum TaxID=1526 RepID=UPI00331BFDF4
MQGIQYCDRLFRLEDYVNSHYPSNYEKCKQYRLKKEKPILEAFWSWLNQLAPVRNTRLDKAVTYVKNQWPCAETYLEDGRCSFTNNLSENAIRPFTVGRKNWLFCDTVAGAEASSVVYTLVEMAKTHGLNIYDYLQFGLDSRPDETWTDEQLAALAPWSENVQHLKIVCETHCPCKRDSVFFGRSLTALRLNAYPQHILSLIHHMKTQHKSSLEIK